MGGAKQQHRRDVQVLQALFLVVFCFQKNDLSN